MDEFNAAAGARSQKRAALLEGLEKTRRQLDMADAATRHDWAEVARLYELGARPDHRDKIALKELTQSDDTAAADAAAKMNLFSYPPLLSYSLIRAVETGNLATVAHIIAKNPSPEVLNHGACVALMNKQQKAADLLLAALPEDELRDNALFGMLVGRPDDYRRITEKRGEDPDYLMHFLNACRVKDEAAIDLALDKMLEHRDATRRRIAFADDGFFDMGGSALHELTAYVVESGYLKGIGRFMTEFRSELLPDFLLLHVALIQAPQQPEVFAFVAKTLESTPQTVASILMNGASPDRRPAARYLMETAPEVAQEESYGILRAFAGSDAPQEFFDALGKGITLPKEEQKLAKLLAAAIEAKNDKIVSHLETAIGTSSAAVAELQSSPSTEVMLKAAEIGGDWHFRGEALFWRAASEGRRDILDAMPRGDGKLLAAMAYQVDYALDGAIKHDDMALLDDILKNTPWTDELRDKAAERLMNRPGLLPRLADIGYEPRPLKESDMHALMRGQGKEALAWLTSHGYYLGEQAAASALQIAVKQNESDTIEYLLGSGIDMVKGMDRLLTIADYNSNKETLGLLEKWLKREERRPAPDAETSALDAAGAVAAAYADALGALLRKAVEAKMDIDPAILVHAKDEYGNSALDILGAHGKLNDILVPELWRDRDAVAFVRTNTAPCYHDQCDFSGLKAALDQMRLKEGAKRLRLAPKGP